MTTTVRPKIIVSKCLEFDHCRFNGQVIPSQFVKKLIKYVDFVQVCPEVEIGLGVPRDPIKLIEKGGELKLVQPSTDRDLTRPMQKFAEAFLRSLKDVDGFILKYGSPSCGISNVKIYPRKDNPIAKYKGAGMFARAVEERFSHLAVEDEGRLTNFRVREHFLTKIFLLARFREVKRSESPAALIKFQAKHKLLLMAYSQKHLKLLGQVTADTKRKSFEGMIADYERHLYDVLKYNAKFTSHINVLMHALGYFKGSLQANEKKYFLDALEKYRNEMIPLSAAISIMQSWIIKYDTAYLKDQAYFEPYPEELITITDSGKGRDGK